MSDKYTVVRTDNMFGVDVRSGLVSIEYLGADGQTPTAIENGSVLKVGALKDEEREIFVGGDVSANDNLNEIVLVASPEVMYEEDMHNLDDFINPEGAPARGYRLHNGDIFSVTIGGLVGEGEPQSGDVVELVAGTKLGFASSLTSGSTQVGYILKVAKDDRYTYYAILVVFPAGASGEGGGSASGLPAVTAADNGKTLRVVNGAWALVKDTAVAG